jgi:predicted  nucleic acid-binding Zn-ribbon protein
MGQVSGVMNMLEIPTHAWKRDIDAERRMRDFNRHLDELLAGQGERDAEVQLLDAEIRQVERRLAEARSRRHQLAVNAPNTIAGYSQRIGQLRSEHPHLFHGLDDVVRHRLAEKARKAAAAPQNGWGA